MRRFYTPPLLTPSNKRTEPVLNGVKPLVKCHTHLRLFWPFSNTPAWGCLQDAWSRGAGRLRRSLPRAGSRPEARDPAQGAVGFAVRPPVVVSTQPFASAHELAQPASKKLHHELTRPALRNLDHGLGRSASGEMVSTRAAPSSQPGSTNFMNHSPQPGSTNFKKHPSQPGSTKFKKLRRGPAQPAS